MDTEMLLKSYAKENYKKMFREPMGQLNYKFIVPGATYTYQLWDWDSWLTDIALRQLGAENMKEYEIGCILNFLEHTDEEGVMPIVITPETMLPVKNGALSNSHKPCLAQHIAFIVEQNEGDITWLEKDFHIVLRYIDYYMKNCRHENGIYFWIDDCAIGVDNDPCTFYRPKKSSGSIFLNCMMYKELEAVCYLGNLLQYDMKKYEEEKEHLKKAVQDNCYDERDGFYYSVDLNLLPIDPKQSLHSGAPRHWDCLIQRIGVWSGFMAMWSGIATKEQAERMVKENLLDEKGFWARFGVRTLAKYEKMYSLKATGNPSCWLGPIWGIANYFVFRGLVRYGYDKEATELAEKTIRLFEQDIAAEGCMHEYYDPETGMPIIKPGFQNWNLLAVNMQAWLDKEHVISEF